MTRLHHANIFKSMKEIQLRDDISHECGVTMNESVESRAIADVMARKPGITVTYLPAMIRIDGEGRITFKMSEISEALGREMTPYLFEIATSTHYGRMIMVDDDTIALFGDLDEALKCIEG
jgi:propane monooxygenase coupling protein